jgi:transcriptional regulator with XRE-family HTH domain
MTHRALGAKLKELLDERGMTQVELARHLHLGKSTVSQYISGTRTPDLAMLVRLARFFSVSVDYLLGLSDVRWPAVLKDPDVAVVVRRAGELAPEQKARLLEYIDYLAFEAGRKESGRPGGASPDRPNDPT